MGILQAIFLGIVQGVTEFLPVSSDGHLALAQYLLGVTQPLSFDVLLHFASLAAIMLVLWKDIWSLLTTRRRLILPIIVGTIPAGIVGLTLEDFFDTAKADLLIVGASFMITGLALAVGEWLSRRGTTHEMSGIGILDAGIIGVAQSAALLPGVSRSGMTISAALARGVVREDCVRFSFILALPAMAGATLLKAPEVLNSQMGIAPLAIATFTSFVFSVLAMKLLLGLVRRTSLGVFSYYCLPLGMLLFVLNAPAPVSNALSAALSITASSARIIAYLLIAAFFAAVIRFVFFGLLRGERSARPLAPE